MHDKWGADRLTFAGHYVAWLGRMAASARGLGGSPIPSKIQNALHFLKARAINFHTNRSTARACFVFCTHSPKALLYRATRKENRARGKSRIEYTYLPNTINLPWLRRQRWDHPRHEKQIYILIFISRHIKSLRFFCHRQVTMHSAPCDRKTVVSPLQPQKLCFPPYNHELCSSKPCAPTWRSNSSI